MSGRRGGRGGGNRIRGPQSALTDFLAANNISAAQIRDDYDRRRRQSASDANATGEASNPAATADDEAAAAIAADAEEQAEKSRKRKRQEKNTVDKIKKAKASASKAAKKKGKKGDDDDDDDDNDNDFYPDFKKNMYKKSRPPPGQFEWCEVCEIRFTVTPYNKEGPDGGLLCTKCGKQQDKDLKSEKKAVNKPVGRKRRKLESDRLDGLVSGGAKSLQELCISRVAVNHEEIEELGDLPQNLLGRLAEIFSKKRVMKPRTLPLFLRGNLDEVNIPDAAYLEEEDYHQIFAVVPDMEKLVLQNSCQLKDKAVDYMLERCHKLRHIQIYAGNLVSTGMWHRLFHETGRNLEVVKLKWLDASFEDATVQDMVKYAPNLRRVKLELCRRIGEPAVTALAELPLLEHLSLQIGTVVSSEALAHLVAARGPGLRTLSLKAFFDADDTVLAAIHQNCVQLSKLRINQNDTATDAGIASLFTDWQNSPLTFIDFDADRDVDNNNPNGPEDATGLASAGFQAMMAHSGSTLRYLNIASCRHIELFAFMEVFNGAKEYPALEEINVSFCNRIDNSVIAGIFKSCSALKKLVAFGCFSVYGIVVPKSTVVVGIPTAQDAIEQFGVGIGVDEAIGRMVEAAA